MQITDILAQTGGAQSLARDLGVSEAAVTRGAEALGPMLLGGFRKQAQSGTEGSGGGGLGGLLSQLGGGGLLDSVLSPGKTDTTQGDAVLGQVFGSKEVSRTAAQAAAAKSGLDPALLKRMLPLLAMLVAGYLSRQHGDASAGGAAQGQGGGLGGLLGGILGGAQAGGRGGGGLGGLASMADADGDGNPFDDLLRMAGRKSAS